MPAMQLEGDYLFPQEASLRGTRGDESATIAIWGVPELRPEHEFKSAFSTRTHSNKLSIKTNSKRSVARLTARVVLKLDANEPPDATVKYAWVTP